jgi:hypothetical protein
MKKFISFGGFDLLWLASLVTLVFSVIFTLATGESPMEAWGISPAAGTIGMVVTVCALLVIPFVVDRIKNKPTL